MSSHDPRVDDYISRQADFARPILEHLRATLHLACPQVEETIKWRMPAFTYKGRPLANVAAFKAHAAFGFWQHQLVTDTPRETEAMGSFGRLTSLADLPDDETLKALIGKAMALVDSGAKTVRKTAPKADIPMPDDLAAALGENRAAQATYDGFPPSCRREYLEWVTEAKRPETRAKRIAQAVEQMAAGKKRNWKYENC